MGDELDTWLASLKWQRQVPPRSDHEVRAYATPYAVMVVASLAAGHNAERVWLQLQDVCISLRQLEQPGRVRDIYLVLIVDAVVSDEEEAWQRILDDTHVCRKVLVETSGRSLREALEDVPLLFHLGTLASSGGVRDLHVDGISDSTLEALCHRSASWIVDRLLVSGTLK